MFCRYPCRCWVALLISLVGGLGYPLTVDAQSGRPRNDPGKGTSTSGAPDVRIVGDRVEGQRLEDMAERKVLSAPEGTDLGIILDLVIDPYVEKVIFAVVAAPTAIDELRLVPLSALHATTNRGIFRVEIDRERWSKIPPVKAHDFDSGRIPLTAATNRMLAEEFGQRSPAEMTDSGSHLVRLADLRGKPVSTGTENVGTIRDILVDAQSITAFAIIKPTPAFSPGPGRNFAVPLHQLNLASREMDPIVTNLKRPDFERAKR